METTPSTGQHGPWDTIPETHWRAYIGPNAEHYMAQLERIRAGRVPAFNWAAFLVTLPWMAFRRMHLLLAGLLLLLLVEGAVERVVLLAFAANDEAVRYVGLAISMLIGLLFGTFGDRLYLWDARRAMQAELARGESLAPEILLQRIARRGGTSWAAVLIFLGLVVCAVALIDLLAFKL